MRARPRTRPCAAVCLAFALLATAVSCSDATPDDDAASTGAAPIATSDPPPASEPESATTTTQDAADPTVAQGPDSATPGTTAIDTGFVPGDPGALEAAGLQVVETEVDLTSIEAPMVLTRVQNDRLLADVDPVGGWLGSSIDELVPLPADVPPFSYFLASWVTTFDTPAALEITTSCVGLLPRSTNQNAVTEFSEVSSLLPKWAPKSVRPERFSDPKSKLASPLA